MMYARYRTNLKRLFVKVNITCNLAYYWRADYKSSFTILSGYQIFYWRDVLNKVSAISTKHASELLTYI